MEDTETEDNGASLQQDVTDFSVKQKSVVRARRETLNKCLKDWGALRETFRHKLEVHNLVFRSIANILQVAIRNGEPLLELDYHDKIKQMVI
jgi:hypothetical protein